PSVPFSLGVRIANNGQGVAGDVKIDSAQVKITENDQGLAVDFFITGTEVNGEVAPDTLLLQFGDIEADSTAIGRWLMTCSLSGRFTEFDAQFIHSDDLGGELTSIIEEINQHFLVRDVLVDLPGRDTVRDFLGRDGVSYTVYESDAGISSVSDMSEQVTINLESNSAGESVYALNIPPTAGFVYFSIEDPEQGGRLIKKVVRSDGKIIKPDNAWLAKKRVDADWSYSANVFDFNTSGTYIMTMIDPSLAHQPPEFEDLSDPVVKEEEVLEFLVKMKCSEGGAIRLDVSQLPVGAEFIDLGNCTGILRWTPQDGQAGDYPITITASDGELSSIRRLHLIVTDPTHIPVARFSAAPTSVDISEEVRFTDASVSEDGIQSWLWDFGDGTTSADRHPTHTYETAGRYRVSLTVTERDADQDTISFADFITVTSPDEKHPVIIPAIMLLLRGKNHTTVKPPNKNLPIAIPYLLLFGDKQK
ncbi:MAG: PKD domain-containing protein, partial [Candidatus Electrothrix sp. AR5]|nr:PKD domain-containing protein [Candidatus Electrothrix sp. AR5]